MSRELRYPSPAIPENFSQVAVPDGGTTAATGVQAVQNLGGIHSSEYSQPLKPVRLTATGLIPSVHAPTNIQPFATLVGDTFPGTSQSVPYEITNFSSFMNYDITVTAGSVSRSGNIITFNTPAQEGMVTLRVNGRELQINVENQKPRAPTILAPTNLAVNVGERPTLQASAFEMNKGSDTHLNTDWEVATDANFTNIIAQSLANSVNKLSWQVNVSLSNNTQYFARVRYRGTNTGPGNYSAVVSFTTKAQFYPSVEVARTSASVPSNNSLSRDSIAISDNGNVCVVGAPSAEFNGRPSGFSSIFRQQGNGWLNELNYTSQDVIDGTNFPTNEGRSVAISADGFVVATGNPLFCTDVGSPGNPILQKEGKVTIKRFNGTTWANVTGWSEPSVTDTDGFGYAVALSENGKRLLVTKFHASLAKVYIFQQVPDNFGNYQIVYQDTFAANSYLGGSVAMSRDGNFFVVGIDYTQPASNPTVGVGGSVAVYRTLTGNAADFQRSHTINSPEAVATNRFGVHVAISDDGRLIFVGDPANNNKAGAVYVFRNVTPLTTAAYSQLGPKITLAGSPANVEFGRRFAINGVGTYLAVGAFAQTKNVLGTNYTAHGASYIYSFNESTGLATLQTEVIPNQNDAINQLRFGSSLAMTRYNEKMVIGASGYSINNNNVPPANRVGAFYTFA